MLAPTRRSSRSMPPMTNATWTTTLRVTSCSAWVLTDVPLPLLSMVLQRPSSSSNPPASHPFSGLGLEVSIFMPAYKESFWCCSISADGRGTCASLKQHRFQSLSLLQTHAGPAARRWSKVAFGHMQWLCHLCVCILSRNPSSNMTA